MDDSSEIMRAVAGHGLHAGCLPFPDGPLSDAAWNDFIGAVVRRRLIGLLAAAVRDGALGVSAAQFQELATFHARAMQRVLDLEVLALRVVDILDEARIGVRALKGLATAHLDMADPAQRDFGDVDLLVEPGRFTAAIAALRAGGMPRDLPERRPGFDERFAKEATLYGPKGVEVDLHRLLALGVFGQRLEPRSLWDVGQPFDLGGRRLVALSPEGRLLHACYNTMLGDRSPRLVSMRDVAQLAQRSDVDFEAVTALAEGAGGAVVVARALRLAGATLGTGPSWALWEWARAQKTGRWQGLCLRAYESQGGSNTLTLLSGLAGLRRWHDRGAYLQGLMFPSRTYVRARSSAGRPSEWRRGLIELASPAVRTARRRAR